MSEGERLFLLVEPDASSHRALESALTDRGDRVLVRESAEQALEVLCSEPVDLVIASTTLADGDGFRLCSLMRDQADFDAIPLLFISDDSSKSRRLEGLQSGAADYVTKPFFFDELEQRIDALLDHDDWVGSDVSWEVSEGSLADRSLVDILSEVEVDDLTGTLSVERDGRQAVVHFESGDIVGAVSGTLEGKEALLGLVAWPSGEYVLRSVERDGEVDHDPDNLVLVSIEPLEPWNEVVEDLPQMRRTFARSGDDPPSIVGFDAEDVEAIWELVDGERTIGEVVSESPSDLIVTLRIVSQLLDEGALEDVTDREEVQGPGSGEPKPQFARWIDPVGWSAAAVEVDGDSNGFQIVPPPGAESETDGSAGEASEEASDSEVEDGEAEEASETETAPEEQEEAKADSDESSEAEPEGGDTTGEEPEDEEATEEEPDDEEATEEEPDDEEVTEEEPDDEEVTEEEPDDESDDEEAIEEEPDDEPAAEESGEHETLEEITDQVPEAIDPKMEDAAGNEIPGEVKDYDPDEPGIQPFSRHEPGTIEHVHMTLDEDSPAAFDASFNASHEEPPSERVEPVVTPDSEEESADEQMGDVEGDLSGMSGAPGAAAETDGESEEPERDTPADGSEAVPEREEDGETDDISRSPEPDESRSHGRDDASESAGAGPMVAIVLLVGGGLVGVFLFTGGEDEDPSDPSPDPDPTEQVLAADDEQEDEEKTTPSPSDPSQASPGEATPRSDRGLSDSPKLQVVRDSKRSGRMAAKAVAARAPTLAEVIDGALEEAPDEEGGRPSDSEEAAVGTADTDGASGSPEAESTDDEGGPGEVALDDDEGDESNSGATEPSGGDEEDEPAQEDEPEDEPAREGDEAGADDEEAATEAETSGSEESSDETEDETGDDTSDGGAGEETFSAISGKIESGDFSSAERELDTLPSRLEQDEKVRDLYLDLAAGYQTEAGDVAAAKRIYQQYLDKFPEGKYASQVRSILSRLNDEE